MSRVIRRATSADCAWLLNCTKAAYSVYIPVLGREPLPMTLNYQTAIDEYEIWIAGENKLPVGLLMLENKPDHIEVYSVAVLPAFKGQGIGKLLLNHADTIATQYGHNLVRLYTNERMKHNIAIYRKLGYVDSHIEKYRGLNVVHLKKLLNA